MNANRISIHTTTINGRQHVTVYLSDGITITERAGSSIIKTIIRTHVAHAIARRKYQKQLRTAVKRTIPHNKYGMNSATDAHNIIVTDSNRLVRFKSRVDGAGKAVQIRKS